MAVNKTGGGRARMKTSVGADLSFSMRGDELLVWDRRRGMALVTIADVDRSNGVNHVMDSVLPP